MSLLKEFIEKLESEEEDVRLITVEDIVDNNMVEMVPYLIRRLTKEDSIIVKETIVYALKNLDCSGAYNQLFYLFKSPDAYLRNCAIGIFASSGDRAVDFLSTRFEDEDKEVKKLILDTLFEIGSKNAILIIRRGLRDEAINVKITAVEYLGRLKDLDSIPDLLAILESSEHPMLIVSVIEALLEIDDKKTLEKALNILIPDEDIGNLEPIYIPGVLKILGRLGRINSILKLIEGIDVETYAEEIISMIEELDEKSLVELFAYPKVQGIMIEMVRNKNIDSPIRYKVGEYISRISNIPSETLLDIGTSLLLEEDSLKVVGINLISLSKSREAKKILLELLEYTDDEVIRKLCLDTLNSLE